MATGLKLKHEKELIELTENLHSAQDQRMKLESDLKACQEELQLQKEVCDLNKITCRGFCSNVSD